MARILRFLILAAIGGLIAWAIAEPINSLTPSYDRSLTYGQQIALGAIFGIFVGLAIGLAEALSGVSPRDAVKSIFAGILGGAFGGAFGLTFANSFIYIPLLKLSGWNDGEPITPLVFGIKLIGRTFGWGVIGLFAGLSQGIATESTKKMINGAIGGFLGGGVGGFVFQILTAFGVPSEMLRLIGFTTTAGAIGLFIGFIEEMTKRAWLVHLKGRNEGKEFQIYKQETVIGRDELADVSIFGDPDVEPRHFVIRADQHRHLLKDLGTVAGTSVNGQKVQQQLLRDGDIIQIGMTRLLFRDKATRSYAQRPVDPYSATGVSIPNSQHICPFCGGLKDASGNCSCAVGAPSAAQIPGPADQTIQTTVATQVPQMTQPISDPFSSSPTISTTPGAGARFVAVAGPYTGQVFNLNPMGETTIGRQSDRNISLSSDNTTSRQHARVANEGGQFVLYDMGSANGTHVNNSRIDRHVLTPGDLVQIGNTKFRYEV